jgi:hypothetical protein
MRAALVVLAALWLVACGHPTRKFGGQDVVKVADASAIPAGERKAFAAAAMGAIGDRLKDEAPEEKKVVATLTPLVVGLGDDLVPAIEAALASKDKSERAGALHVLANGGAGFVRSAKRKDEVDRLADASDADKELIAAAREALSR